MLNWGTFFSKLPSSSIANSSCSPQSTSSRASVNGQPAHVPWAEDFPFSFICIRTRSRHPHVHTFVNETHNCLLNNPIRKSGQRLVVIRDRSIPLFFRHHVPELFAFGVSPRGRSVVVNTDDKYRSRNGNHDDLLTTKSSYVMGILLESVPLIIFVSARDLYLMMTLKRFQYLLSRLYCTTYVKE